MADRIEWFDLTIPAATPVSAPVVLPMNFPQGDVVQIDVKVLDGPCGSVGFQIGAGGSQYVPNTPGTFIRPNDDYFQWPQRTAINTGSFTLIGYNLDSWPHNIQVGFEVNELGVSPAAPAGTIGVSGAAALDTVPAASDASTATFDPLSPDSILAAATPAAMDLLAQQLPDVPVIGVLSDAGAS